ncbi:hypothetical protein [Streptomyces sp. ODS28]|uniref:hypothetical protein n=1 Tax=Streptomyces sp. ODS28 TaxID=3136688 RepID=UPI0031EA3CAB
MAPGRRTLAAVALCAAVATGATGCMGVGGGKDGGKAGADRASGGGAAGKQDEQANGIEKQPVKKVAERTVEAMRSASALRMKGALATEKGRVAIDLALAKSGDCSGTFGVGGGEAELRKKSAATYVKADSGFFKALGKEDPKAAFVGQMLKGRWIKLPAEGMSQGPGSASGSGPGAEAMSDPGTFCKLSTLTSGMKASDAEKAEKGKPTTVAGRKALPLVEKKNGGTETSYIAMEGEPYLLKLEKTGGKEPGSMTFGDYGKPLKVAAPPKDGTVDLGELAKGGGSAL